MSMRPSIHFTFEVHTGDGTDVDVEIDMLRGPVVYQQGLAPGFSSTPVEASIDRAGGLEISDVSLTGSVLRLVLRRPKNRPYLSGHDEVTREPIIVTDPEPLIPLPTDTYVTVTGRVRF